MPFRTQALVKSGFDWNSVYPTEQGEMKTSLNFNFNLADIQFFLQKQSDDFKKETAELIDLDTYMYGVYLKHSGKPSSDEGTPTPEPTPDGQPKTKADYQKAITGLKIILKKATGERKAQLEKAMKGLTLLMKRAKMEKGGTIESLIPAIEADGEFIQDYPVDESQTNSNAGDAVVYWFDNGAYEIITWNERAENHKAGDKEISKVDVSPDGEVLADGGKILSADELNKILKKYKRRENNNYHSENVVLLAEHFGDADDLAEAKRILKAHLASTEGIPFEEYEKRIVLSRKLYPRMLNALSKSRT